MKKSPSFIASYVQNRTGIALGLCMVLLAVGAVSVRAAEVAAPAAPDAREAAAPAPAPTPAASEPVKCELDHPQLSPSRASLRLPVLITPNGIEKSPVGSTPPSAWKNAEILNPAKN